MLRFALGMTRMDKSKNEFIRETAAIEQIGNQLKESRLSWYGFMLQRDEGCVGKRVIGVQLPRTRSQGRSTRQFMDVVKDDLKALGVIDGNAMSQSGWRIKIFCGDT